MRSSHVKGSGPAAVIAAATFVLVWPGNASAQSTPPGEPPAGQPPQPMAPPPAASAPADVSDEKLEAFAEAYVEVQEIQGSFREQVQTAEAEEAAKIQREAEGKAVEALQEHGITPTEYNQLLAGVNADEQLRERALEKIQEASGE